MEHEENQETGSFMPVIPRLDRLDRVLKLLEDHKHSLSRRDFCGEEKIISNKDCKTLSSALEEVQHKGTLIERLTALENRVLELSLEIDEGNTSKSSSSTVEASGNKTVPEKRHDESPIIVASQDRQDPPTIQAQKEGVSSADGYVRLVTDQHKIIGQKQKTRKKWRGLFRLACS